MNKNIFKKLDWITISIMLLIFSIGAVTLYSATSSIPTNNQFESQILKFAFGLFIILCVSHLNPILIKRLTPKIYLIVMLMLIAVLFFGKTIMGAKRWLDLYFIQIQPSELVKVVVPAMLAYIVSKIGALDKLKKLMLALIFVIFPVLFVINQPDLGTSILIVATSSTVIFCSGLSVRFIFSSIFLSILSGFVVFKFFLKEYQINRIATLFNPESDPMGSGYHVIQSKIAIGSGGLFGKGIQEGTQSQLSFIPEQSTDFIFAVFLEEFGFLGFLVVMFLFALLIFRLAYMTTKMQDTFSKLFSVSIIASILIYCFVNMGMIVGILPVVGIPLPFFSYGGSSMLVTMFCIGLINNFYKNRKMY